MHYDEGGPLPADIAEAAICERFGWTPSQLDEQDGVRVSRMVGLQNINQAYSQVLEAIRAHRIDVLSAGHWEIYKYLRDKTKDVSRR